MSFEIDGSAFGMRGTFKRVSSSPIILDPCKHLILPLDKMLKKIIIFAHGKEDGTITFERTDV